MRILITNNTLDSRAGTELYVRDVATALLRRGITPIAYSTVLGEVAQELRMATVPVIDRLDALATPPDLIHGHHHLETMTALLHFPGVPAIYFCHGWLPWEEAPPTFPRILRYVAVDETCSDRLRHEHAIAEDRIRLLLNFVDLNRFKPRHPLPDRPRRALVLSNYVTEQRGLAVIREACARDGIKLDAIGASIGNPTNRPEQVLHGYDLIFAKGRAALEALSVGAAVVLFDAAGVGSMVTTANVEKLRLLNFGVRTLQNPVEAEVLKQEIGRYNAADAMQVSSWVRQTAGLDDALDRLLALYDDVLGEHRRNPVSDNLAELRAASDYLRRWVPNLTLQQQARAQHEALTIEHKRLWAECEYLREQRHDRQAECDSLKYHLDSVRREHENLQIERDNLRCDLDRIYGSPTLRLRNRLIGMPLVGQVLRSCVRLIAGRVN
jgi:hypothetical protein